MLSRSLQLTMIHHLFESTTTLRRQWKSSIEKEDRASRQETTGRDPFQLVVVTVGRALLSPQALVMPAPAAATLSPPTKFQKQPPEPIPRQSKGTSCPSKWLLPTCPDVASSVVCRLLPQGARDEISIHTFHPVHQRADYLS